jgi:hypothetical protein
MPYGGYGDYGPDADDMDETDDAPQSYGNVPSAPSTQSELKTVPAVTSNGATLQWPIGLQILAARGTDELRQRIESLVVVAANQQESGQDTSETMREISGSVKKLRRLLVQDEEDRFAMPRAVYAEAKRFLSSLEKGPKMLQASQSTTPGK